MSSGQSTAKRMEEGEVVEGRVAELDQSWSDYRNRFVPVVVIKQDNGELRTIIAFHEILERKLANRRPRIGDRLKITYHGEQRTKDDKRTVKLYSVEGGQEPQADTFWAGFGTHNDPDRGEQPLPGLNTNAEVDSDIPY